MKKSKLVAGLLGIFLGTFGIHNFYIGRYKKGIIQLLITVLSFGALFFVSTLWGLIDGFLILFNTVDVNEKYRKEKGSLEENKEFAKETFKRFGNNNKVHAIDYIKEHTRLSVEEIKEIEKNIDLENQELNEYKNQVLKKQEEVKQQETNQEQMQQLDNTQEVAKDNSLLYSLSDTCIYLDRIEQKNKNKTNIIRYEDLKEASLFWGNISLTDMNNKIYSIIADKSNRNEILEFIQSKIPEINHLEDKADFDFIEKNQFEVTKNLILNRIGILIDDNSKRIIIKIYNEPLKIYNYDDIMDYELTIDKQAVSKASGFNTYMGRTSFWSIWSNGRISKR